ncbi:MAG: peptidoglycan DD-metalloendopeptidase family protein [Clostridia bacterium]|nr:peptidoglycan DD-metalloendopeptidase family protein [Clostridia bacterium]
MAEIENTSSSDKHLRFSKTKDFLNKMLNIRKSDTQYLKYYMIALCSFIIILIIAGNFKIGYAISINNVNVGFVTEKNETYAMIEDLKKELSEYQGNKENIILNASYSPVIALNHNFSKNPDEIINNVKASVDFYYDAYAVYVDNTFAFGMESKNLADETIQAFTDMYTPEGEIISIEVQNSVEIKPEKVLYTRILNKDEGIKILKGYGNNDELYTVQEGDTLWGIGIHNDITSDDLMLINELETETIVPGQKLRITNVEPLVNIKVIRNITYTEYQPYETEYIYDSSLTKGTNKVVQNGSKGEKNINATVTTINNHETDREIISETIVSEPVKNIIKVGTKPKPKTAATGRFMRPISGGYVSSAFGSRSRGYHTGIDYALSYGSPIYAADGGTVTSAGWGGGYGYMIKINHGNGYETLYAHCSKLAVKSGTKVAKGQVIAYVGSTGNSTGPHLHFEIRKNGSYLNPAKYV